ncbi:zinc ABC transporter substrate-binding protein [Staphylococcus cohnii]|uniref:metal ABC transporter solute-binding protein, Zn/Mn family n=1 Tax=Staphylococcus cohnii TaxID=29382 RepID=UPI0024805D50|nr:zinc ABC transporter substrate-binding protein [Staphylococcus cohnii]MDE1709896.1 zinc ABC transporter substrate-binding protein [Staphylococcus cohnii]
MKKIMLLILTCIFIVLLSACGNINSEKKDVSSNNRLKIYTTAFAFQSFTNQIGGKYVEVDSIYPPGADMHSFEPTQKEMINIAKSDLFIYSNEEMDPVAKKVASSIKNNNLKLPVAAHLDHQDLISNHEAHDDHDEHEHHETHESHNHGGEDPHVWLDPVLNKKFAKVIKNDLIEKDPKHKTYYTRNYNHLIKDMNEIDHEMKRITQHPKRDTAIISHDSIGYLANRYHFKQQGVSGMNNEEPSQRELMNIVQNINKTKQPYVLYEQNITSKVTNVIQKESNTTPLKFHNMATLSKEDIEDKQISYQSLMKENMKSLNKALNE